jgi:Methyltransferase FkbM domain
MRFSKIKALILPSGVRFVPILRGPFRGAWLQLVVRDNIRKIVGLYEHELNDWIEKVLPRVDSVIDVGANDGYFTFGCAAAFHRSRRTASIMAFEPQAVCCQQMAATLRARPIPGISVTIEQMRVGAILTAGQTTLDEVASRDPKLTKARRTLVKIDVEGNESDVIDGASGWLNKSNYFVIEVHREKYVQALRSRFASAGLVLDRRDQRPLPLLGAELRTASNCWLVSSLK